VASLLSTAEAKALIKTSLSDVDLQVVITRAEAEVIGLYGAHFVTATSVSETLQGGDRSLYLRRRLTSVTSVTEYLTEDDTTGAVLTSGDYRVWQAQGRLQRLPGTAASAMLGLGAGRWGAVVTVSYVPADDTDVRKAAIVDLVRLALERTAMRSESVAGEYSYTAPDWTAARNEILNRLGFVNV
jgi:hypothetical protein